MLGFRLTVPTQETNMPAGHLSSGGRPMISDFTTNPTSLDTVRMFRGDMFRGDAVRAGFELG